MRWALLLSLAVLGPGCATARLVGDPPFSPADPGARRVVVLEPLFETAEWQTRTQTEYARVTGAPIGGGFGSSTGFGASLGAGGDVAIQRQVNEKHLYARVASLVEVHRQLLAEVQRLRPSWRVTSTSAAPSLSGPASLVRVVVSDSEKIESNRALKNTAFAFGLVILPLQIINIWPVEETDRVYGQLLRYELDGALLKERLVRYPTQPDYAINTSDLGAPLARQFGLDVAYEEGLLADEAPRGPVLLQGFAQRLAAAVVAIIEEPPAAAAPPR